MSRGRKQTFGSLVRQERERLKIGLREMARRIGMSPTYLSMIERDKFPPPAEDKITAIAQIIGSDRDELLALAGRVGSDLQRKIMEQPRVVARLIREFSNVSGEKDLARERRPSKRSGRCTTVRLRRIRTSRPVDRLRWATTASRKRKRAEANPDAAL
jgi:HTH-type transcriptional regulator, competence development regulator